MYHPLHAGQFQYSGIIHIAMVAQHADGGPFAAWNRFSPETHFLHGLDYGIHIRLGCVMIHDDQHV